MGTSQPRPILTPPTNVVTKPSLTRYEYIEEGGGRSPGSIANVQEFGAQGNGTTDDTASIQAAINSIPDDTGGTVYMPAGTYKVSSTISVKPGIKLLGENSLASIIKAAAGFSGTILTRTGSHGQFIWLEGFRIDGNRSGGATGTGISLSNCYMTSQIIDVTIIEVGGSPIAITDADELWIENLWCNGCDGKATFTTSTQMILLNPAFERCGTAEAVKFTNCDELVIEQLGIEQTTGSSKLGAVFDSCIGFEVHGGFAFGTGVTTPGTALQINSVNVPARTGRYAISNFLQGGFASAIDDLVAVRTVTNGVTYYCDTIYPNRIELMQNGGSSLFGQNNFVRTNAIFGSAQTVMANAFQGAGQVEVGLAGLPQIVFGDETRMIRLGAGTPEGAITASVGALFLRTDGGAGTTLYIKETGAGNTGWVGK